MTVVDEADGAVERTKVVFGDVKVPPFLSLGRQLERVFSLDEVAFESRERADDRGALTARLDPTDVPHDQLSQEDHGEFRSRLDPPRPRQFVGRRSPVRVDAEATREELFHRGRRFEFERRRQRRRRRGRDHGARAQGFEAKVRRVPDDDLVQRDPERPHVRFRIVQLAVRDDFGRHPQRRARERRAFRVGLQVGRDAEIAQEDLSRLSQEDVCSCYNKVRSVVRQKREREREITFDVAVDNVLTVQKAQRDEYFSHDQRGVLFLNLPTLHLRV